MKKQYFIPQVETMPLFNANALCAGSGIRMSAGRAAQNAVRTGDDVDVEVGIHFQSRKHDIIQLVDECALVHGVGIFAAADLKVPVRGTEGGDSAGIEVLSIRDAADIAFVHHFHHGR